MDSVKTNYRSVVEQVLKEYAEFLGNDEMVQVEQIFDRERDRYLLVETGWNDGDRGKGVSMRSDSLASNREPQQEAIPQRWALLEGVSEGFQPPLRVTVAMG